MVCMAQNSSPSSSQSTGTMCTCVLFLESLQLFHVLLFYYCHCSGKWYVQPFMFFVPITRLGNGNGQLPFVLFELTVLWLFTWWWLSMGVCLPVTSFLYSSGAAYSLLAKFLEWDPEDLWFKPQCSRMFLGPWARPWNPRCSRQDWPLLCLNNWKFLWIKRLS